MVISTSSWPSTLPRSFHIVHVVVDLYTIFPHRRGLMTCVVLIKSSSSAILLWMAAILLKLACRYGVTARFFVQASEQP